MSGIAGVVFTNGRPMSSAVLDSMVAATPHLRHGVRTWSSGPAGLVRFELATTPESLTDGQPTPPPGCLRTIAFDGRLDNRAELLDLLGPFSPGPDAADARIVLALHEQRGDACFQELVGDWALALWDPAARRLLCARSPVGLRPFLWMRQGDTFAFATEPRSLVDGLALPRRLDEGVIAEYLSLRFVSQTGTFWQGLHRLPPGWAMALEGPRVRTWLWHTESFTDLADLSDEEHVARFRSLFDEALVAANRSRGPVAAHLSGGLDSSSVVCRSHELLRAGRLERPVLAVSARFPGEAHDETEWSSAVEAHLGIDALVVEPKPIDLDASRTWCAETLHLPLRPNTLGTMVATCTRLRADGIHVLLTGEGGDDWLTGSSAHWPDLLLRGRWRRLLAEGLAQGNWRSLTGRLRHLASMSIGPLVARSRRDRLLRPHLQFSAVPPEWIGPEWARRTSLADRWRDDRPWWSDLPTFAQKQRYAVYALARRHVNWDNLLAFAANQGIEMRHPLHDLRLTRFLMGARGDLLRYDGVRKVLLREAMRGTLPEKVRTRQTKARFSAPIVDGTTAFLRECPIPELHAVRQGWVDGARLARYQAAFAGWRAAGGNAPVPKEPFGPLWAVVALELWLRHAARI